MTKIAYFSDIHCEFSVWYPCVPDADFIVFAGDILTKPKYAKEYFENVHEQNPNAQLIYVFGNHEFYKNSIDITRIDYAAAVAELDYVHVLDNATYINDIHKVRFIGSTLWSDLNKENPTLMEGIKHVMNDYHAIRKNNYAYKFTPYDSVREHRLAKQFIINELEKPFDGQTVIVTHHSMTLEDVHILRHGYDEGIKYAYHSDMNDILEKYKPVLAIHGHNHNTSETLIRETKVVTNARGYVPDEPNYKFVPNMVVDI